MRRLSLLLVALGCSSSQLVLAQAVPPAPPDPPAQRLPQPPLDPKAQRYQEAPGENFLSQRYGLSRQQAARQLALEDDVSTAAAGLQARYKDDFLASIIDHTPVFQATFVFSRDVPADEVRQFLPESLRSAFKIKRSRYTAEQIRTRREQVLVAMRSHKVPASVGYDHRTDKFELTTEEARGRTLMGSLPPDLRDEVRFVPGGVPKTFQTGARAGDSIYGGWRLYQLSGGGGQQICTFGFTVLLQHPGGHGERRRALPGNDWNYLRRQPPGHLADTSVRKPLCVQQYLRGWPVVRFPDISKRHSHKRPLHMVLEQSVRDIFAIRLSELGSEELEEQQA